MKNKLLCLCKVHSDILDDIWKNESSGVEIVNEFCFFKKSFGKVSHSLTDLFCEN